MEIAGLVVGVAALVSTIKDCIELFEYISAARELGHDAVLLDTQLDIEKTLLLHWCRRVRLLQGDYDDRLDDPQLRRTTLRVLASIATLLSEATSLSNRYGLQQVSSELAPRRQGPLLSKHRMEEFLDEYDHFQHHSRRVQATVSTTKKARWVVRDRSRFEDLVQRLGMLIAKLNDLLPGSKGVFERMTHEDFSSLGALHVGTIREASEQIDPRISILAKSFLVERCQQRILELMWFRTMDERRELINAPENGSYKWILETPGSSENWDDLSQWLRSGQGVYWISGKAGSGKSTLMKAIWNNQRTHTLLKEWAGHLPLHAPNFFFWHLGTDEQKSQYGLCRALLYQILQVNRPLIKKILPDMWSRMYGSEAAKYDIPSPSRMPKVFDLLWEHSVEFGNSKYCFFIDGLDEYSGHYQGAVQFIDKLSKLSNVKILVSSRPEPGFVDAFSSKPMLKLEDLTRTDIKNYVEHKIEDHPHMAHLLAQDPVEAREIITELVDKASGVFLWVVLACRSVLDGFIAFDRVSEIRTRVEELPPELAELFRHMLGKIEPRYRTYAAKIFKLCHINSLTQADYAIPALGVSLLDQYDLDILSIPQFSPSRRNTSTNPNQELEGRLRSRCWGLVEVRLPYVQYDDEETPPIASVQFMHKTVLEFLNIPEAWELGSLTVPEEEFDASAALAFISTYLLHIYAEQTRQSACQEQIQRFVSYCSYRGGSSSIFLEVALDRFIEVVKTLKSVYLMQNLGEYLNPSTTPTSKDRRMARLVVAVELDIYRFVQAELAINRNLTAQMSSNKSLLYHAIRRPLFRQYLGEDARLRCSTMRVLLKAGCNPNQVIRDIKTPEFDGSTGWSCFLEVVASQDHEDVNDVAKTFASFLGAGADPFIVGAEENIEKCFEKFNFSSGSKQNRGLLMQTYRLKNLYVLNLLSSYQRKDLRVENQSSDNETDATTSLSSPMRPSNRRHDVDEDEDEHSLAAGRVLRHASSHVNRKARLGREQPRSERVTHLYGQWDDSD
ncbi:hypothetical protein LTR84_002637 [Exophiala bonariae]|uniref:NACHT domain-containing protein n=1 Tax=Exophiala bonariae TaxID=1690606 RepID=A0AAV9NCS0_9EURO|nr:hypothetical protein LTR84_002637 [Exophiala bonariae]